MPNDKYIVFKREDFFQLMGELALPPHYPHPEIIGEQGEAVGVDWDCAPIGQHIQSRAEAVELKDAVVIRRQDAFSPFAFEAYANGIRMVSSLSAPEERTKRLDSIADYFQEQATLAWDTNRKFPD